MSERIIIPIVGMRYSAVLRTTTAAPTDLLYLNDDLFTGGEPAAAASYCLPQCQRICLRC